MSENPEQSSWFRLFSPGQGLVGVETKHRLFIPPSGDRGLRTQKVTNSSKEIPSSAGLRCFSDECDPRQRRDKTQSIQKAPKVLATPELSTLLQDPRSRDSTSFTSNLTRV